VIAADADEAIRESDVGDGLELAGGLYGRWGDNEIHVMQATVFSDVVRTRHRTRSTFGNSRTWISTSAQPDGGRSVNGIRTSNPAILRVHPTRTAGSLGRTPEDVAGSA
jgi:hypothetical protein